MIGKSFACIEAMSAPSPTTKNATQSTAPRSRPLGMRLIAVYEVVKTVGLLLVAMAAFHLDRPGPFEKMLNWLEHLSLTDTDGLRWQLVNMLTHFGPSHFDALGMISLGYAVIFAIEGVGLWMGKYWAEWFTVIATGSLIPVEIYETVQRFHPLTLLVLIGNIAIVVYLVREALRQRRSAKAG